MAAAGLALLQRGDRSQSAAARRALRAFRRPRAELAAGLALAARAHAAIDISDGLAGDAAHLAEASGVRVMFDCAALEACLTPALQRLAVRLGIPALELALQGGEDYAFLFRDGKKYDIRWSTKSGEYEKRTGLRRPIQFINTDGSPAVLKPGHTWIFIATPYSVLSDQGDGVWKLRYYPPDGAK